MSGLWIAGAAGLAMGLRHAADPDHVVAVSTIVARTRRASAAWVVGAAWGLGHTATLLLCGAAIVGLGAAVPERLAAGFEALVGVMLVALGVWAMRDGGSLGILRHEHAHSHEGGEHGHHLGESRPHRHAHVHLPGLRGAFDAAGAPRLLRSAAVGMVHGLAGSSAIGLAVSAAMPPRLGLFYIAVSGLGTLLGMAALSTLLSWSMVRVASATRAGEWLGRAVGAASIVFGLAMVARFAA